MIKLWLVCRHRSVVTRPSLSKFPFDTRTLRTQPWGPPPQGVFFFTLDKSDIGSYDPTRICVPHRCFLQCPGLFPPPGAFFFTLDKSDIGFYDPIPIRRPCGSFHNSPGDAPPRVFFSNRLCFFWGQFFSVSLQR
ncbi:hypothetical protein ES708_17992 [subsurface metagenome]